MLPRLFMAVGDFRASSVNACDASMEQLQFSGEEHGKKICMPPQLRRLAEFRPSDRSAQVWARMNSYLSTGAHLG